MRKNESGPLEYGPCVPFDGRKAGASEVTFKERLKSIARSPDLMRKLEEQLDRDTNLTRSEKRRAILAMKRLAGSDEADDLAPLAEALRRLAAEMA